MEVRYLSQPFPPDDEHLGNQLNRLLSGQEGRFDTFIGNVAFVKFSGVSRIYSALQEFRKSGGKSRLAVGINHGGTSQQGLEYLRKAVDSLFVYFDNSRQHRTFHPKVYLFEQEHKKAVLFVGSGNLTAGGLFLNYESQLRIDLDLSNSPDRKLFESVKNACELYFDKASKCAVEMTDELFEKLVVKLPDETQAKSEDEAERSSGDADSSGFTTLFGASKFSPAPSANIKLARTAPVTVPPPSAEGFWKMMSPHDVHKRQSPGQIVIPKRFRKFFPPVAPSKGRGAGYQWEASFAVIFKDGSFLERAEDARFVVYKPKPGHKRSNIEDRFTFHEPAIFSRLGVDDVLVFRLNGANNEHFQVERIAKGSPNYRTFQSSGRRFDELESNL
jgi:HKD family nuclease